MDMEIPMVPRGEHAADLTPEQIEAEREAKRLEDEIARVPYTPLPPLKGKHHKQYASPLTVRLMRLAHRRTIGSAPMPHTQMRKIA